MATYNKFCFDDNVQLEFDFETAPATEAPALFARKIAKSKGISILHAQAAIAANSTIGDRNA